MIGYVTDDSPISGNYFPKFMGHEIIGPAKHGGSYAIIEARLVGLSYPDYLCWARDNYNGIILGRTGYSTISFKNKADCDRLVAFLNKRWDIFIQERNKG